MFLCYLVFLLNLWKLFAVVAKACVSCALKSNVNWHSGKAVVTSFTTKRLRRVSLKSTRQQTYNFFHIHTRTHAVKYIGLHVGDKYLRQSILEIVGIVNKNTTANIGLIKCLQIGDAKHHNWWLFVVADVYTYNVIVCISYIIEIFTIVHVVNCESIAKNNNRLWTEDNAIRKRQITRLLLFVYDLFHFVFPTIHTCEHLMLNMSDKNYFNFGKRNENINANKHMYI